LLFEKGRLAAALAGVCFSATLALAQMGLYAGFLRASSALIAQAGGDVWVMARGTAVLDNGPALPEATRGILAEHPCVAAVRAIGIGFATIRSPGGAEDVAMIVGFEPRPDRLLPWDMIRGLPQDMHDPMRVAVDESDLDRLGLSGTAVGQSLHIGGQKAIVAGVTRGIKSFNLSPYMFADIRTLRALTSMGRGQASYWVADLKNRRCAADVIAWVGRNPKLVARTADDFRTMTESYWVWGSGAGEALAFGAIVGLLVGCVIVAQTLFTMTRDHFKELTTLKAIGASRLEVVRFVGWQAGFLAVGGSLLGLSLAFGAQWLGAQSGLSMVLSPQVLALGIGLVVAMCAVASIGSIRAVLRLDPAQVFQ
jgi:putative ABC transport system permease protein